MEKEQQWQQLPPLALPSPVFALAAWRDQLWAGGVGGVARCALAEGQEMWEPGVATLSLAPVAALLALDGLLLAGGSGGIAYSYNSGTTWQQAELEDGVVSVAAFAASPNFASDRTIVAATMTNGIVRTNDGGRTWTNASFGLGSLEVTALLWITGSTVLAATSDGIYRSGDAGRGWRCVHADEELEIEGFVSFHSRECREAPGAPPVPYLAVQANGSLLSSHDSGKHWSASDPGLRDAQVSSCSVTSTGTLLLGTLEHGLLCSEDAGASWQSVYKQAVHVGLCAQGKIYVGTSTGVSYSSDDGLSWHELPCPPVHDARNLLTRAGHLLLTGTYSGILHLTPASSWAELEHVPQPLTACAFASDHELLLSGPDGLLRLSLEDGTRQMLLAGPEGQVAWIAMCSEGAASSIWIASADGTRLLRSRDGGASWQQLDAPFGILPLVALQAVSNRLIAATYDPRQYRICLWHSSDDGETWVRSIEAGTNWPLVASCAQPAAFSIGNVLFLEQAPGQWRQATVGSDGGAVRRVLGIQRASGPTFLALTTTGIQRSEDGGETWQLESDGLPGEQILDIAISCETLSVLLTAGRVWRRALQEERELV